MIARSLLFFPGHLPALFEKALRSGADAICLDLEDAVPPGEKAGARDHAARRVREWQRLNGAGPGTALLVRINPVATPEGREDLGMLRDLGGTLPGIVVPKVGDAEDVGAIRRVWEGSGEGPSLIPLIETARGLHQVENIALSSPGIGALLFGGVDFAADIGASRAWDPLLYARSRIVHAAALAEVPALDTPFLDIDWVDELVAEADAAREMGFTGKAVIHPAQVEPVQRAFTPSDREEADARRIVTRWEESGGGASRAGGLMIDAAAVRSARRVLARAELARDRAGA